MIEILKYRDLIIELVKRDIKKRYRRSVLGIFWSMLNPFFIMLITAIVFSNFFKFAIKNFPVYLLTAQLMFNFYVESTTVAMGSILENSSLIKKVYIPKYIFPLTKVLSACVNFILSLPGLIIMLLITKVQFKFSMLLGILPIIYLLFFCFGIGLILSTTAVFFRDIFHLYGVLIIGINYLTPIFYPIEIIPDKYRFLIQCNPLYYYVKMFREIFYEGIIPSVTLHGICIFISIISVLLGMLIFIKNERKFILYI